MAKVKILIKGYVNEINKEEFASSTTVLIQDKGIKVVVDPGINREALLKSLSQEELEPEDIDFVIVTHTHLDHCLLAGIFRNAKILDNRDAFSFDGQISEHKGVVPGTDIKIIATPGHEESHCSILVDTEDLGKVVIAGDVFWWTDEEEQKIDRQSLLEHEDTYAKDEKVLRESREKVLKIADHIIPGHGEIFKPPQDNL